jgi:hypothetical protein
VYDVPLDLDACAYRWADGNRLRVSVAGSDWPNTVAPPEPVTLTVHGGRLELPLLDGDFPEPSFTPGQPHAAESADGVVWEVRDDVLRRVTSAHTFSESAYDVPDGGRAREAYSGEVSVDRRSFEQRAHAETVFDLTWPGVEVSVRSVMDLRVDRGGISVEIDTWASRDGEQVSHRRWTEHLPGR